MRHKLMSMAGLLNMIEDDGAQDGPCNNSYDEKANCHEMRI